MSLLDDVSIVVTPNGYKAGELYAVIPVPTLGSELGDTGTISNNAGAVITKTSSLNYNATSDGTSSTASKPKLDSFSLTVGKRYRITIAPSNQSGTINFDVNNDGTLLTENNDLTSNLEFDFTNGSNFRIVFDGTLTFNCDFVISLKELTSADMDVTRATAATRVDENGLVNYAEVLGSELVTDGDFPLPNTNWSLGGGSEVTVNGLRTNNTVITGNSYAIQELSGSLSGKQFVFTYDVITTNGENISIEQTSNISLNTSTTGTNRKAYFTWSRGDNYLTIKRAVANTDVTIDNVSVKEVTRDNVPRIDYTGGGCPHILAEPQRTNLVTYSSDFTQWGNARTTDTANQTISPDGSVNATYLEQNTGETNAGSIYLNVTLIAADYSFSIFAKKKEKDFIVAYDSNTNRTYFNISNGTLGNNGSGGTSKIEDYGNGWYRCSVSYAESSAASTNIAWYLGDTNGSTTVTDSGGVYIYGCQVEEGSYPTSLIPTSGSTVTRNQDQFTRDGIGSLINSTEGVLFAEIAALANDGTFRNISLNNGTTGQAVRIYYRNQDNKITVLIGSSSGASVTIDVTDALSFNKIAVQYKVNDVRVFVNGSLEGTITSVAMPVGLNELALDIANVLPFYGKVKQLQVYDTALTDNQLIQLTGESGTHFFESYAEMAEALTYTIQ